MSGVDVYGTDIDAIDGSYQRVDGVKTGKLDGCATTLEAIRWHEQQKTRGGQPS